MFLDLNDEWQSFSYPTYYVISPADSLIQYQGSSFNLAKLMALDLVPTGTKTIVEERFKFYYNEATNEIQFASAKPQAAEFSLLNLVGQSILQNSFKANANVIVRISLPKNLSKGIYLAIILDEGKIIYSRKIMLSND